MRRALLALVVLGCSASTPTAPSPTAKAIPPPPPGDGTVVRGITVSTPTWGWEWGTPEMDRTLDLLVETGANWVAIHPYARVHRDGRVTWRDLDPDDPPPWLARPIAEAHRRGLRVLIKPHLAYWGSGFSWRGEIDFEDPAARARFFRSYSDWIAVLSEATSEAEGFVVGTELDRLVGHEPEWRSLIRRVRAVHGGHLTYAANWDAVDQVPFWDDLDAIGVQAYHPLNQPGEPPTEANLRAGWATIRADMARLSAATGKPVVFTELGYDESPRAAVAPWESGRGEPALQRLLLRVALEEIARDDTIRGAFLWKWFPGERQTGDFRVSRPDVREVVRGAWVRQEPSGSGAMHTEPP